MEIRRKVQGADDARACLAAAAASGLGRADWARQNGVDARSLNIWRLHIEGRSGRSTPQSRPRWLELVPAAKATSGRYVIRHADFAVEVDEKFDDEVLGRLLAVVARC